jgi:putative spermidine/putrescine transport system ATP-binding protein
VRPQNLKATRAQQGAAGLSAKVLDTVITGSLTKVYLDAAFAGGKTISVAFPTSTDAARFSIGETLDLKWRASDAVAIAD